MQPNTETGLELNGAAGETQIRPDERPGIRRIIASLSIDSFAQSAIAGTRGTATARQVVLRAEEFDIHVRICMKEESRELLGQIRQRGTKTFTKSIRLHLIHNGERISSADTNDLGEFHFTLVPVGLLSLQIELPHLTVVGTFDTTCRS